jgi:hypothetical protein
MEGRKVTMSKYKRCPVGHHSVKTYTPCVEEDCQWWPVCSRLEDIVGRFLGWDNTEQIKEFFGFLNSKRKEE